MNKNNKSRSNRGNSAAYMARKNAALARKQVRDQLVAGMMDAVKTKNGSMPDMHHKIADRSRMGMSMGKILRYEAGRLIREKIQEEATKVYQEKLETLVKQRLFSPGATSGATDQEDSSKLNPAVLRETIHPPVMRNLIGNKTYYTRINLHHGTKSTMLRAAEKNYPSSSVFQYKTPSTNCADMIYGVHGINQKGYWRPYTYDNGSDIAAETYNDVNRFMCNLNDLYRIMQKCLGQNHIATANAFTDNEDLLWAFESTTNKALFRNGSELTPVTITAYLLKCKKGLNGLYPWDCVTKGDFPTGYISNETVSALADRTGTLPNTTAIATDVAARLGFTPQLSQYFTQHWDVVDVFKSPMLDPGDQWDLTVNEHFSKMKSYQMAHQQIGLDIATNRPIFVRGDYELLIQWQGAPGFCENILNTSSGMKRISTASNPSMITCTQSRSVQTRFENSIKGSLSGNSSYFTSNVVREVDTGPRVSPYFGDGTDYEWRTTAMTNTEDTTAKADGI